jgi:hypothetical protein
MRSLTEINGLATILSANLLLQRRHIMHGGMIQQLTRAESWMGQLVENMITVLGSIASQQEITKTMNRE